MAHNRRSKDWPFPDGQFLVPGYEKPYREDRDRHGGGIIVWIREDITNSKLYPFKLDDNVEGIFIEISHIEFK